MSDFPSLPVVRINEPCSENWNQMTGDEQSRFCGHCDKHVHNFSEMSASEVRDIIESGENVCVRMQARPDGTVVTREKSRGVLSRVRGWAALATALTIAGCAKRPEPQPPVMMGAICAPTEMPVEGAINGSIDGSNIEPPMQLEVMGEICVEPPSPPNLTGD